MATLTATAKSASANSYATLAEGNAYHETVRNDNEVEWLEVTDSTRERLLILATRLIDQHFDFIGYPTTKEQALVWPREAVLKSGRWSTINEFDYLDRDVIPQFLKDATSEFARLLIATDTTSDADGAGFRQIAMAGLSVTFNEKDRGGQGVLRSAVFSFLRKYGTYKPSLNSNAHTIGNLRVTR